jgi:transcriptional regulator with XRE-family HTH domain
MVREGVTPAQLARELGVEKSTFSRYLHGHQVPHFTVHCALMRYFACLFVPPQRGEGAHLVRTNAQRIRAEARQARAMAQRVRQQCHQRCPSSEPAA